jgi:hypothetical protein
MVIGSQETGYIPPNLNAADITTDFGRSWHQISLPHAATSAQALSCAPSGKCYLVFGTSARQFNNVATTSDEGRQWRSVHKPPGFTSLSGFSCPSTNSCVYLANQVFEVTTDGGKSWRSKPGPFSAHHDDTVSAFSLSCTSTSQCLVGGITGRGAGEQQITWTQSEQWSDSAMRRSLDHADMEASDRVISDLLNLPTQSSDLPASAKFESDLLSDFETNCAATEALALHARGQEQRSIAVIGQQWADLDETLSELSPSTTDSSANSIIASLESEIHALFLAERIAGDSSPTLFGQITV